ncbi:hypothetical protein S83_069245, partial [Arachis hypogaea]
MTAGKSDSRELLCRRRAPHRRRAFGGKGKRPPPHSWELLYSYKSRFQRLGRRNLSGASEKAKTSTSISSQKFSTEEKVRLVGTRYVQYSSQWQDNWFMPMHPYAQIGFMILSEEENRDIDLAQFLLALADKIGCQQFE